MNSLNSTNNEDTYISDISKNDLWDIIYSYFKDTEKNRNYYLTNHHLDSYNDFILNKIPQTLKENSPQTIFLGKDSNTKNFKYELDIYYGGLDCDKVYLGKPIIYHPQDNTKKQMFPNEARLKNLTYASHIFCDIDIVIRINSDDSSNSNLSDNESESENKNNTNTNKITFEKISLGLIPIMLHSKICVLYNQSFESLKMMGECPYEQGGYFIIDGKEKIIVSHERKAENKIYVQNINDDYYSHSVNIKSVPQGKFKYPKTTEISIKIKDESMEVRLPGFSKRIPLFIIFRALGFETDKEILELILGDLESDVNKELLNEFYSTVKNSSFLYKQIGCITYLKDFTQNGTISEVINIINNELIPHIGYDYTNKAYFLAHMVKKLVLNKKKIIENTDRDSFAFKRVDLSGFLLAGLFRDNFIQFQRNAKIEIEAEYRYNTAKYKTEIDTIINESNLRKIFLVDKMNKPTLNAFKLGTIINKKGLIQTLGRRGFADYLSHTRRINTPTDNSQSGGGIMMGQRKLHSTQYGIICPIEAPDGGNVGIKKHMTVMTSITFGCDTKPIEKCIREFGLIYLNEITPDELEDNGKVFINGNLLGIHQDTVYLLKILKLFRRNAFINIFTSLHLNSRFNELYISTDGGRCCRPIAIVENNKLLLNKKHIKGINENMYDWNNLIMGFSSNKDRDEYYNCDYKSPEKQKNLITNLEKNQGVIEYIDTDELHSCLVATTQRILERANNLTQYTHCELHPSMIFGILGFICPFSNFSQSARNVFGAGQGKQACGIYVSNYRNRMDSGVHILNYPEKPIVNNKMNEYIFNNKLPCGKNIIVAIGSFGGYNQEDSVIINNSSLEKGCFITTYYKTYESYEKYDKRTQVNEIFYSPENDDRNVPLHKGYNYSKLDEFGVVKENTYVNQDDVIIGQYAESPEGLVDISTGVKKDGGGLVDKVYMFNTNSNNNKMCKVRLSSTRFPEPGDKFASRHGQKGTIGIVMKGEDMPYSKDGIVPDMIINPHCFPSRMTIGQFLESLGGKLAASLGFILDGTPFEEQNIRDLGSILQNKCNFDSRGTEILYNGRTGKQMSTEIFIGPTYYQRLKQMVQDKINSRAPGAINYLTKQPPAGRAAGGGLRLGEMERDAVISHGIANFLKETTMDRSDAHTCYVSNHTGEIAAVNPERNIFISPSTDGPIHFEGSNNRNLRLKVQDRKSTSFSKVKIPYSVKLLIQECEAIGVNLRIITDNNNNELKVLETQKNEDNIDKKKLNTIKKK